MIDYKRIGARIAEERKYIRHISQEQMAVDLGMYQADISNLEHARKSSGINDLYKLEMIADYFDLPIENLLFGTSMEAHMIKYYGSKMEIKSADESYLKKNPKQKEMLKKIIGEVPSLMTVFTCGPYAVYILFEELRSFTNKETEGMLRWHLYTFFNDIVIGNMTVSAIKIFDLLNEERFEFIHQTLPPDIMDVASVQRMLNPYIPFLDIVDEDEREELHQKVLTRMDALRPEWETEVFLIESVYVMEDCRQHGIFRLMLDVLKQQEHMIIWLNLEPSLGEDFDNKEAFFAEYADAEIGQMNLNAMIAEKVGLTVDSETVRRYTKTVDINGTESGDTADVRKYAYYIPDNIKKIIEEDHELVELDKQITKAMEMDGPEVQLAGDIYHGAWKKHGSIISIKMKDNGRAVYVFKRGFRASDAWYGVSYKNPATKGEKVPTIERFKTIEEAMTSKYAAGFTMAEAFWTPIPEEYLEL